MRHRSSKKYFNRDAAHRRALTLNLTVALLKYEQIKTTLAKAKYLRTIVEPLITRAKKGSSDLSTRRYLKAFFGGRHKDIVEKLLKELSLRFKERSGGYTRVLKCGFRVGDAAPMAYIQLVDALEKQEKEQSQAA